MINKKLYTLILFSMITPLTLISSLKKKGIRNNISHSLSHNSSDQFTGMEKDKLLMAYNNSLERNDSFTSPLPSRQVMPSTDEPSLPRITQPEPIQPVQPDNIPFTFTNNSSDIPLELKTEIKNPDDEMADALEILNTKKDESIEFHFENASLFTLIQQIESIYNITFIYDDIITPTEGAKAAAKATIKGNKITFKTHKPLSRDAAWNLFTTFLEISGFTVTPMTENKIYRIQPLIQARKSPLLSFIGTDPEELPTSDEIIRYVYFIKNSTTEAITNVVKALKSNDAPMVQLLEHKAFLLTDKAYNIRVLMEIVKELDQTTRPQSMSVLKLQRADAQQVKQLYESLINPNQSANTQRIFKPQQKPISMYFPEDMKIIVEKRTNTLIILGPQDAIKKIEEFIIKYIDVDLEQPYSPLHVFELRYANASAVVDILREVTEFGSRTQAGINGGVRGGDQYLRKMSFVAEESTNKVIVRGDYDDVCQVAEIIKKLDEQQQQVEIEVLILDMSDVENKQLGAQLRTKSPGTDSLLGNNVQFQTSGIFGGTPGSGIVENTASNLGATKLLGNLVNLVTGNAFGPGNTIINLGHDMYGVWGIFQMLQTISNVHVLSNPFVTTTNKTKGIISLGTTRRVVTSTVQGNQPLNGQGDEPAALTIEITPQINSDGMITLDYTIDITEFTNPTNPTDASKSVKKIKSKAIVADQEILALGGLVRNQFNANVSKTPLLGDIPFLNIFFKNKNKSTQKQNLLILLSTRIVSPDETIKNNLNSASEKRYQELQRMTKSEASASDKRDPIHRMFFDHKKSDSLIEDFIFEHGKVTNPKVKKRRQTRLLKREEARKAQEAKKVANKKRNQQTPLSDTHTEIETPLSNQRPLMVHDTTFMSLNPKTEVRV